LCLNGACCLVFVLVCVYVFVCLFVLLLAIIHYYYYYYYYYCINCLVLYFVSKCFVVIYFVILNLTLRLASGPLGFHVNKYEFNSIIRAPVDSSTGNPVIFYTVQSFEQITSVAVSHISFQLYMLLNVASRPRF
jgi:hypothetical protein